MIIFITAFEGIEAKNILRTPILGTLLENSDAQIVLLMKSKERADYYKKEFSNDRITYEVVPYDRSLGRGLDRFFNMLKFTLLRTDTIKLRREMAYELTGKHMAYFINSILNFLLARPHIRKIARTLDFLLVKNIDYVPVFNKYNPDLVFMAHLFEGPEAHILREAKKRGIKTMGFINSWDKITARCIMRLLPDKAIVFNNIVKNEMITHNEMHDHDIFVSGLPQYDEHFIGIRLDRAEFFKRIGVDSSKKIIVYAPMGRAFSNSDWDMIDLLYSLNDKGRFGEDIAILVRFQPNDFVDEAELKKRPNLIYDCPGIRFSSKRGADWDMDFGEIKHLSDTLSYMSILVCYASSVSIDAAVFDKPVININFEINPNEKLIKSPTQYYKMEHYKKALDTGGICMVNNEDDLIASVNRYLENPSLDKEGRRVLVKQQCKFTDGKSGERISKFIMENKGNV